VYLVNLLGGKEEKANLNVVFNQLDKNKDGNLSKQELLNGWNTAFKTRITDEEIEKIFFNIDTNQNGLIDYSGMDSWWDFNLVL